MQKKGFLVRRGFTLIEILIVIAIIVLLVGILLPSLVQARQIAQQTICATNLKGVHKGLCLYAVDHKQFFPPFAYSSLTQPDVTLSGHWGGAGPNGSIGRVDVEKVNLHVLIDGQYTEGDALLCPARDNESYFADTDQFSSYCLRFPYSEDLFLDAPDLAGYQGELLNVYRFRSGGHPLPFALGGVGYRQRIPLLRWNRTYETFDGKRYDPSRHAVLAGGFWYRDYYDPSGDQPARRRWLHGDAFPVVYGDGGVEILGDDGTVDKQRIDAGESPPEGPEASARQAERIWSFFDSSR